MTVYEYSIKVNKTVEEILILCKKLQINVSSKDDVLSTEDMLLLDKNIQNITYSPPSSGGGTVAGVVYSTTDTNTTTNPTTTQNTNSEINIDPECFIKECNLIKNIAGKLSSFSETFTSVNVKGDESINNELLIETQNIGSILDSQKITVSNMVTEINGLQERIVSVKSILEKNDPELALLFAWLDTEYFAEFNKNDDLVGNIEKESSEQQTTSSESDQANNDKSANDVTTADTPTSEFTENLDNLSPKSDINPNPSTTYLQPKNNTDISHRGYGANATGNNYATNFISAGEKGFWGCEADVRLYNGNLVCSHNNPDTPQGNKNPTSFEEYLDICKEYGMTAVIDLKYNSLSEMKLSEEVIRTIEKKSMLETCIIQTNNHTDIPHIRELSEDARIWYLVDTPDVIDKYITPYNVEGVNICAYAAGNLGTTLQRIKTFVNNGIDVCVWGVTTENGKKQYLDAGASHVMSDYVLGITPYQEGEIDYNKIEN